MADKEPLPTYDWHIRIKDQERIPVHASYYQLAHDGEFFEFKDQNHKGIYLVAKDAVIDIGRIDPQNARLDPVGRRIPDEVIEQFDTVLDFKPHKFVSSSGDPRRDSCQLCKKQWKDAIHLKDITE